ncbi:hypothetical protein [Aquimarina brevivitae]|uniref:Leucine rich repeat (LRR) protein n=1 Tax=Aquimarina brevivitae TaxID=323412 RepID=A0A4V2F5P6_9FLAO|nr:hypothetical protein [Aquimarina brevivitae]RZS93549.1 hypothetical protein EV197_2129 [Aquimarina brevivitae]
MRNKERITICDESFKRNITHFSFQSLYKEIEDMKELKKLKLFPNLTSISLNGTNITDYGLQFIGDCSGLENINLTFTSISDLGIVHLTKLNNLKHLRLKETYITAKSIVYFNQMPNLKSLQIHETEISGSDLKDLSITGIEEIFVDCDNPKDFNTLLTLSEKLSKCTIHNKGNGFFKQGKFKEI